MFLGQKRGVRTLIRGRMRGGVSFLSWVVSWRGIFFNREDAKGNQGKMGEMRDGIVR